jgi:rhodanese-related sulfurtransferase
MRGGKVLMDRPAPPPIEDSKPAQADTKPAETVETPAAPAANDTKPETTPSVEKPAAETKPQTQPKPSGELPQGHITVAQARALFDQNAFFVDARRKEVYAEGHIAGAFRADMESFKTSTPQWVSGLPKDMKLVVYCNGGDCDESEHVAQMLNASGFSAVYIIHDGFPGWKTAGHPIETGEGQE